MKKNTHPIGIFDSGIGGLTVCKALADLMPHENIIYFGDTARFPYGTRSKETIIKYSEEISEYLLSQKVKMIVVACNTSSAAALPYLKKKYSLPIIGVIEAGAEAACQVENIKKIGVLATRATVNSRSYVQAINKIKKNIKVYQQQATLFVPLIEEGIHNGEIAELTIKKYLQRIYKQGVRTIILGCTHFPLLKKTLAKVYPDLLLIDTAKEVANQVKKILINKRMKAPKQKNRTIKIYASDITETMKKIKKLFFGDNNNQIKKINLKK